MTESRFHHNLVIWRRFDMLPTDIKGLVGISGARRAVQSGLGGIRGEGTFGRHLSKHRVYSLGR
jgi:hypothetical protein